MVSISCPHCQTEHRLEKEPDQDLEINCESCQKQFIHRVESLNPAVAESDNQNTEELSFTECTDSQPSESMKPDFKTKSKSKYRSLKWILLVGSLAAIFISLIPQMVVLKFEYQQKQVDLAKIKPPVIQNGVSIEPLTRKALISALSPEGQYDALSYKWRDFYFRYDLRGTSESRNLNLDSVGYVNYVSNSKQSFASIEQLNAVEKTGSATGFVVHPEGIIVTCAHVVFGAKSVSVELDGTEYQASIIGYHPKNDLAILKIKAEGLTFIPLAEANQIELAKEVQLLGYPLSDTMGRSLEFTQGSVTEIVNDEKMQTLQIDTTIHPGSSGGPVIDNQGRVIGVASWLLSEEKKSNVGFAVAAEEVSKMLSEMKVPLAKSNSETILDSQEIARRTKPATAIIKVQTGVGGFRFVPNMVNYHFTTNTIGRKKENNSQASKMLVDKHGKIYLHEGQAGLPYRLGSIGKIGIEQLSQAGEKEWQTEQRVLIPESEITSKSVVTNPGLLFPGLNRKIRAPDMANIYHPAVIRTSYKIVSETNEIAKVEKKYSLLTIEKNKENKPYLEITGEGSFDFNRDEGYPIASTMNYKITQYDKASNEYITLPVTLNYSYLEFGEELKFMVAMNNGTAREYIKKAGQE